MSTSILSRTVAPQAQPDERARRAVKWFYRGRHRRNQFSITVAELVAESKRINIADVFTMMAKVWDAR
jgi:hypothetical protein